MTKNNAVRLQTMPCALCGADHGEVLYEANFRPEDLNERVFSARRLPDRIHYQVQRCVHDGMVWSSPVLSADDAARLYARSSFSYGGEVANLTATYLEALRGPLAKLPAQARLLEVGCGSGFVLEALHRRGFDVYGVEPGREAVAQSAPQIREKITVDMFRPGLFPEASFDMVFFFQTLDHIYDPNGFVEACARLLKPGGYVVAFQHDVSGWSARLLGEKSPIIDVEHIYLFNASTLRRLFEKHGLTARRVYSPVNTLSLRHLLWLMPLPRAWKEKALALKAAWLSWTLGIKLGNVCYVGQKGN